ARIGDEIWVSGSIGDAALGLRVLQGKLTGDAKGHLAQRYRLPEPRLALGQALRGVARAAMDVSDGLVQDMGHLCRAAGCGAEIIADALPLSAAASAALARDAALLPLLLTGGDDYELLFAAAPGDAAAVQAASATAGVAVTRLGRFVTGDAVVVRDGSGAAITLPQGGWSHF
ncbi:MAG: thiamine-phosphate kinase, partial [Alphaproteobacteria bacterium]